MSWGEFSIVEVSYNLERTHINRVKVKSCSEAGLGPEQIQTRDWVVMQIKRNITFNTALKLSNGNWKYGEAVEIVDIHGTEFIKTKPDDETRDNLGELPEF